MISFITECIVRAEIAKRASKQYVKPIPKYELLKL